IVLIACVAAMLRRAIAKPELYEGSHTFEAHLVLGLIGFLMITDMFYEGSAMLLIKSEETWLPASQLAALVLPDSAPRFLRAVHSSSYWLHLLTLFFFLNFLPLGKHFHIITALPNVFFRKLPKGSIKPARWGVEDIEELETLGVEKLEDFTWKHILDFYTCTECGRCSDNCPANLVGRPLSPKMITIKLRDHSYKRVPIFMANSKESENADETPMVGGIITDDEIWSCTTCG
ncbi:MAG: 4Fe-4S dicluster domain-containing protein, partial [Desulfobacteraceae bacterium]|nr:4Fe-4S dicluster domain-containing protein [Desulfobacteraceae bacterium]